MISYIFFLREISYNKHKIDCENKRKISCENDCKKHENDCKKLCDSEILKNFENIWFREQCYKKCKN